VSERKGQPPPLRVNPAVSTRVTRSARSRAEILNAALAFLWSHPFRDMTVRAVTVPTGLSRSAFYQYFDDLHDLMDALLGMFRDEVLEACAPWFTGVGDPVALLHESLTQLVRVCHERGPLLRAVDDAAATDERFERTWSQFKDGFDEAVQARIESDQAQGLIAPFDAGPVALALNRLDAHTVIEAFGQHPMARPKPIAKALTRIWISTLYGSEWATQDSSDLIRT
jgi:AcrR family transcriptional regulator